MRRKGFKSLREIKNFFRKGEGTKMEESKKIYIGNLDYAVGESDLKNFIAEKGINATDVKVIMDKYSGRSKGFGFAEFDSEEETQKAIDALNGQDLNGRALRVNKAQKMKPRRDNFGGGGGSSSGGNRFDRGNRY